MEGVRGRAAQLIVPAFLPLWQSQHVLPGSRAPTASLTLILAVARVHCSSPPAHPRPRETRNAEKTHPNATQAQSTQMRTHARPGHCASRTYAHVTHRRVQSARQASRGRRWRVCGARLTRPPPGASQADRKTACVPPDDERRRARRVDGGRCPDAVVLSAPLSPSSVPCIFR